MPPCRQSRFRLAGKGADSEKHYFWPFSSAGGNERKQWKLCEAEELVPEDWRRGTANEAWAGGGVLAASVDQQGSLGTAGATAQGSPPPQGGGGGAGRGWEEGKGRTNTCPAPPLCHAWLWVVYLGYLANAHSKFWDNLCYYPSSHGDVEIEV